jgi:multidrug efflux pump subunit AcrA (membrane-fusion protein)
MEEHELIELRSDEVQEILGTPPSWIVRWGTTIIGLVLISLGVLSYVIKYPDVVEGEAMISSSAPPTPIIARADGNISKLCINEKDFVKANQVLAVLQNTADYQSIISTGDMTLKIQADNFDNLLSLKPDRTLQMGDIQAEYSNFIQSLESYQFSATNQYSEVNVSQTQSQIGRLKQDKNLNLSKISNTKNRIAIANNNFKNVKDLYENHSASLRDLESARELTYQLESELKSLESQTVAKNIEIGQLESRITEIRQGTTTNNTDKLLKLKESVNTLRASIDKWKQTYLITTPIDGQVSYTTRILKEQMFVKAGEEVVVIVPKADVKNKIVGRAVISSFGSGKIKPGQKVMFHLKGFPYQEFGAIQGKVSILSIVPKEDKYLVQIDIDSLKTTAHKVIPEAQEHPATALIITEEKRFLERIFEKITGLFKRY